MKIIGISGSPRKGNTEFMLEKVLDAAKKKGADVEMILLRVLDIKHCTGCDSCFNEEKPCHLKDDFSNFIDKIVECDVLLLGSPNYFKNVSGMMKVFFDRTNSFLKSKKLEKKKCGFVCVGGQSIENINHCANVIKEFIKDHEMTLIGGVAAKAEGSSDLVDSLAVITECKKLGEKIAG